MDDVIDDAGGNCGGRAKRYYALRPRAVDALKESRRALVALWRGLETALS